MAVIETWLEQDLQSPVKVRYLDGSLFSNNGNGNRIGVRVYNNGQPVTLSGTVSGYVVVADGSTVPCPGSKSGNQAFILIPPAAYQPGAVFISVFLTDGDTVTTLAAVSTTVMQTRTNSQVSPGSVVTDWTQTINAAMQSVVDANAANMAQTYGELSFPVPMGKYTLYDNLLYRAVTPIATSESWTAAHWTRVKLADDVSYLKNAINTINGATIIELTARNYIKTSTDVVDLTPVVSASFKDGGYAIIDCQENDLFLISGTGGGNGRLWCFIDSNNNSLEKSGASVTETNKVICAPANASKLIINSTTADLSYIGIPYSSIRFKIDKLLSVPSDYAEYGSIDTNGNPAETENRIRSGFIKPKTLPYSNSVVTGYNLIFYEYDLNFKMLSRTVDVSSFTVTRADRYIRFVIKPITGYVTIRNWTNLFANDFSTCDVFGTLADSEYIRDAVEESKNIAKLVVVPSDYAEYGSLDTIGNPADTENRIRSGFIKAGSVPYTTTITGDYDLIVYKFDEALNLVSRDVGLNTFTADDLNAFYRLVVRTRGSGVTVNPTMFASLFTDSFTGCTVYATAEDLQAIRKKIDAFEESNAYQEKFGHFSLNDNLTSLTDLAWEYQNWVYPQVISFNGVRNALYFTFTTRSGYSGIAKFDYDTDEVTKTYLKLNNTPDDHNLIGVLMMSNRKLLCAYSDGHNTGKHMFIRIAKTQESIESFDAPIILESTENTCYGQLFEYDGNIYLFYRTGINGWSYRISEDFGATWSNETKLIQSDQQYYCQFTETLTDGVLRMCCYSNPALDDSAIRMAYLHLDTMTLYGADNITVLGTQSVDPENIAIIIPITEGKVNRLFNAAKTAIGDNKILYCVFSDGDDGVYYVYDNGESVRIAAAGRALWVPKAQLGVAWIGAAQIAVARGYQGRDVIEIYDYANKTATLNRTVVDKERGDLYIRTGRPMIDINKKSMIYSQGTYTDFYTFNMDGRIYHLTNT